MVQSVLAAPMIGKLKREEQRLPYSHPGKEESGGLFSQLLEEATQKLESAPKACHTTLYGRDSRIQTFQYLSREYHY